MSQRDKDAEAVREWMEWLERRGFFPAEPATPIALGIYRRKHWESQFEELRILRLLPYGGGGSGSTPLPAIALAPDYRDDEPEE